MGSNFERQARVKSVPAHTPTAVAHLAEIADILARGLMRFVVRKSSQISRLDAEISVDISPTESGHAPAQRSKSDDR